MTMEKSVYESFIKIISIRLFILYLRKLHEIITKFFNLNIGLILTFR